MFGPLTWPITVLQSSAALISLLFSSRNTWLSGDSKVQFSMGLTQVPLHGSKHLASQESALARTLALLFHCGGENGGVIGKWAGAFPPNSCAASLGSRNQRYLSPSSPNSNVWSPTLLISWKENDQWIFSTYCVNALSSKKVTRKRKIRTKDTVWSDTTFSKLKS